MFVRPPERLVALTHQHVALTPFQGLGILVVSSYLPELLGICDRVIVLHDLGITGELPIEDATEEAVLRLASSTPVSTNA